MNTPLKLVTYLPIEDQESIVHLKEAVHIFYRESKKIVVNCADAMHIIPISQIIRCKSDGNYTLIYLSKKQKITVAKTLKDFDAQLTEYHFFRIHQSHLINLYHLRSYNKKNKIVMLSDHSKLPVSIRKQAKLIQTLLEMYNG